jgi:transposase InsO family protein
VGQFAGKRTAWSRWPDCAAAECGVGGATLAPSWASLAAGGPSARGVPRPCWPASAPRRRSIVRRQAPLRRRTPEIFNADQGAQFTATLFTGRVEAAGAQVSMDECGRALDNVFCEQLWRSVKYEDLYLKDYGSVPDARAPVGALLPVLQPRALVSARVRRAGRRLRGGEGCRLSRGELRPLTWPQCL